MNREVRGRLLFVRVLSLALVHVGVGTAMGDESTQSQALEQRGSTQALRKAVAGLLYRSESDEPLEVVCWPGNGSPLETGTLLGLIHKPLNAPVNTISLEDFFRDLTTEKDWYNEKELAIMRRFRKLERLLRTRLSEIRVFRVGTVQVGIFIIGVTPEGNWLGVRTTSIET